MSGPELSYRPCARATAPPNLTDISRFFSVLAFALSALVFLGAYGIYAQTPDEDRVRAWNHLQQLASEVRELEECQIIVLVKNATAQNTTPQLNQTLERLTVRYDQKSVVLSNEIEGFIAKYSTVTGTTAPRRPKESLASFRYRVWSISLREGEKKRRKNLTAAMCGDLVSFL